MGILEIDSVVTCLPISYHRCLEGKIPWLLPWRMLRCINAGHGLRKLSHCLGRHGTNPEQYTGSVGHSVHNSSGSGFTLPRLCLCLWDLGNVVDIVCLSIFICRIEIVIAFTSWWELNDLLQERCLNSAWHRSACLAIVSCCYHNLQHYTVGGHEHCCHFILSDWAYKHQPLC